MNKGTIIAGCGVVSAIGLDATSCLDALSNGRDGIGEMRRLVSTHRGALPVAEVPRTNDELAALAGMPGCVNRTALLSAVAALEALRDAGISSLSGYRSGFISANTVGGMDSTEDFFHAYMKDPDSGRLRAVLHHECGSVTDLVADRLGISDHVTTISTACSSSANAIFHAARLIRAGQLDIAIAGGADALSRFTLNGFNTLMILDAEPCRPFDDDRHGLNLGEGAGYVVLLSDAAAETLGARTDVRLTGYCNANDAYHQTASSPDGTGSFLAMQGALRMSGLEPAQISYINLHGTGTQNNDVAEGTAIARLFGDAAPPMSSTKSFTGHTLGASGGVEAVFSVLAIRHGLMFPNLRFKERMKELPFSPLTEFRRDVTVRHVLSNSFGFGGNCSSLIFSAS